MNPLHDAAALLGRLLIAVMYIPAGWSKIGNFAGTSGYIASKGLPMPDVGAAIAIVVELVGGLMLLVGWKTRWAAVVLVIFTVAATVFFHNYWGFPADQQMTQRLLFNKNVAIVGGLLLAFAFGPGRYALDRK